MLLVVSIEIPDRSPRPQVGFNTMKKWNVLHRKVNRGMLQYKIDTEENLRKDKILLDWQHTLCEEWFDIISREKKPKEKWFNNVIRKYSLLLLEKIETSPESIKDYNSEATNTDFAGGKLVSSADDNANKAATGTILALAKGTWGDGEAKQRRLNTSPDPTKSNYGISETTIKALKDKPSEINFGVPVEMSAKLAKENGVDG